ncbi:MAG: hypothetical protein C4520_03240 [Candidatus Abyssobacteria bacterium SURF_5]|uniref:SSD domain-containing protein n=1 Tax=Abyssobacteria bacterium (strain SURF_5) TaxID=2093360 RepID=A0A3A4PA88_ABYX5|nr:MAG: hypothetical protein C4520_03240 [Candidatus Abyssubacteria bacterium SURF_5]
MRQRLFLSLASLVLRRPGLILLVWIAAAAAGLILASRLEVMSGRTDLLSPENPHVRSYADFTREFGTANNIYFIIEGPSLEYSKKCADALAAEIEKHPQYIRDVLHKLDRSAAEKKLFLYFSVEQLRAIEEYLDKNADLLEKMGAAKNLNDVFPVIGELAERRAKEKFQNPATAKELDALAGLLETLNFYLWEHERADLDFLSDVAARALPFAVSNDPDGYLVGKNRKTVILAARPNAEKEDSLEFLKPMMAALVQARENAMNRFPDAVIGMTGLPTFAYGDLRVMEEEMPWLFILALVATVILFFLFFRYPLEIFFCGVSLLLALATTLGAAEILIGHLNIMSSVFAITLVSLGIDFGIHFIARFNNELGRNADAAKAMKAAFMGAGPPITTGALTTAVAFLTLSITDFRGLAELGIIAGTGILLCLLAMMTVLPSLIVLRTRWRPVILEKRPPTEFLLSRLLNAFGSFTTTNAPAIIAFFAVATLISCYFAPRVSFDYNFLHIQPKNSTTGEYEEVLMERTGISPSFGAIVEDDLESLKKKTERLARMPSVARVDAANHLVPPDQADAVEIVARIRDRLVQMDQRMNKNHGPVDAARLMKQFEEMTKGLSTALKIKSIIKDAEIIRQLERAHAAANTFLEHGRRLDEATVSASLEDFSRELFAYLQGRMAVLTDARQLEPVRFCDYPQNIATRFIGKTCKYAAYVFPSQSIWNKDFLDRFNKDLLQVAPNATGTTLFAQSLLEISGRALRQSALLVALAIIVLVILDFRSLIPAALSLISVGLGLLWMLALMELFGWQYNPINIMAVPIILGIGIDSGVHIVHGFHDFGRDVRAALLVSGRAVTVSSLTTIVGFACLLLSSHRGLISLAQLLVLGMSACLIASLIVLPAILNITIRKPE